MEGFRARRHAAGAALCAAVFLAGCSAPRSPNVLLFVMDTTRVDAVSAYGRVAGTTPVTDALAAGGLRFDHAWAQAPWTLPSHASLFTGRLPAEHGVGWQRTRAPDGWVTLAGVLRDAGYETVGVAENIWVSETFNLVQGFERFTATDVRGHVPDVRETLARWARERDPGRPFFLFVNVLDSHSPFLVRETNPFLPAGVSADAARSVDQRLATYFCRAGTGDRNLQTLWGLYLGNVATADRKLGGVLEVLRAAGLDRDLVTVVTSDHGEHFGEHDLVGHQFSLREQLVHVPLVVHGLPAVSPAAVAAPVALVDLMPSILGWAGVRVPGGLAGRPLPTHGGGAAGATGVVAEYADFDLPPDVAESSFAGFLRGRCVGMRRGCRPDQHVFGAMRALVEYPWKLIAYERYPAQLYDLAADPGETRDLAAGEPTRVGALSAELARRVRTTGPADPAPPPAAGDAHPEPPGAVLDRLRALGYVGDGSDAPAR